MSSHPENRIVWRSSGFDQIFHPRQILIHLSLGIGAEYRCGRMS
jgi:hypothetical protein